MDTVEIEHWTAMTLAVHIIFPFSWCWYAFNVCAIAEF